MNGTRARRVAAEAVGSCLLVAAVVGSGIMAERLGGGQAAVILLCNSIATGGALVSLLLAFGPISGAHLNPVVTLVFARQGDLPWREAAGYISAQIMGAAAGAALANAMFGEALVTLSRKSRSGSGLILGELVATFGLVCVVGLCARSRPESTPYAVAGYITAAYWFTSSTSFANPAVTLARALTDSFTGIRLADVPGFLVAQLVAAAAASLFLRWIVPRVERTIR